ncbi:hypothetical protein D3C80_2161930 [compost metagenome]
MLHNLRSINFHLDRLHVNLFVGDVLRIQYVYEFILHVWPDKAEIMRRALFGRRLR